MKEQVFFQPPPSQKKLKWLGKEFIALVMSFLFRFHMDFHKYRLEAPSQNIKVKVS